MLQMIRYIIHLKLEYFEPVKGKSAFEGKQDNVISAKKSFTSAIKQYKDISLVKEEYKGPSYSTAVLVDIVDDNLYEMLDVIRAIDVVDIMEPLFLSGLK